MTGFLTRSTSKMLIKNTEIMLGRKSPVLLGSKVIESHENSISYLYFNNFFPIFVSCSLLFTLSVNLKLLKSFSLILHIDHGCTQ